MFDDAFAVSSSLMLLRLILIFCCIACASTDSLDDLRKTYDAAKLLQHHHFLLHLARAHEFALAVKNGYQDITIGAITHLPTFKTLYSVYVIDGRLELQESIRSKNYFIWSFYETQLSYLLESGTPTSSVYELFTNLYSHLRYFIAKWYCNALLGAKFRNLLRLRQRRHRDSPYADISAIGTEHPRFNWIKDVLHKLHTTDLTQSPDDLHLIVSTLTVTTRDWSQSNSPLEDPLLTSLTSDTNDLILYLRLYLFLLPLVHSNTHFLTTLHHTCRPLLPTPRVFETVANEKIRTLLRRYSQTQSVDQRVGIATLKPTYQFLNVLWVHRIHERLCMGEIKPDERDVERVREVVRRGEEVDERMVEEMYWNAFRKSVERMEKSVRPFMKRLKVEEVHHRVPTKIEECSGNQTNFRNDDSNGTGSEGDREPLESDTCDEEWSTGVMTSYEAYQFWYLQELRDAHNNRHDPTTPPPTPSATHNPNHAPYHFDSSECAHLESHGPGVFKHTHPELFYNITRTTPSSSYPPSNRQPQHCPTFERVPLESLSLSPRDFRTLCSVTFPILNSHNVKKSDIEKLIENLGGTVQTTTGSIDRVFVPTFGSRTTTWHRSHGGSKLGMKFAAGVRRVLASFKVDPGDFEFVSKN